MMKKLVIDVLEMFYNETEDLDIIADRCNIDIMTVAFIINSY